MGQVPAEAYFRLRPGAQHWTQVWKLALPYGCTEAAVPTCGWWSSLETGDTAPKEVKEGSLGEARPKFQQLLGSKDWV